MKENPPVTVFLGNSAVRFLSGELTAKMLYRDVLAERLGVTPKERLALAVINKDGLVYVSALIDDGDLTPPQEKVFHQFLEESGVMKVIASFPEKPTAS
jgi:hypothetical protein